MKFILPANSLPLFTYVYVALAILAIPAGSIAQVSKDILAIQQEYLVSKVPSAAMLSTGTEWTCTVHKATDDDVYLGDALLDMKQFNITFSQLASVHGHPNVFFEYRSPELERSQGGQRDDQVFTFVTQTPLDCGNPVRHFGGGSLGQPATIHATGADRLLFEIVLSSSPREKHLYRGSFPCDRLGPYPLLAYISCEDNG
jgi:hypothetical protein